MALPNTTYDQLSAITQKYYIPKMIDQIYDSNVLFLKLRGKQKPYPGGTKIVVPIQYAKPTANGWYSNSDTLDITDNDTNTAAEFELKYIHSSINITRADELKNSGKQQIVNLVESKVQNAQAKLADDLGTAIYNSGTTANQLTGLRLALAGTGSTYGGISKTTYSWWRGQTDSSTTSLTLKAMRSLKGDATIGSTKPNLIVTTQDIFDDYWALLQPQERYTSQDMASGGFKSLAFEGDPIVVDNHCPTYHMFMLNMDYIDLYVHKDENFRFTGFQRPINQNVSVAHIFWAGELCVKSPRLNGFFSALA